MQKWYAHALSRLQNLTAVLRASAGVVGLDVQMCVLGRIVGLAILSHDDLSNRGSCLLQQAASSPMLHSGCTPPAAVLYSRQLAALPGSLQEFEPLKNTIRDWRELEVKGVPEALSRFYVVCSGLVIGLGKITFGPVAVRPDPCVYAADFSPRPAALWLFPAIRLHTDACWS